MVPVLVLEDYQSTAGVNFTDTEVGDLAEWLVDSVNNQEIGVYDIYPGARVRVPRKIHNWVLCMQEWVTKLFVWGSNRTNRLTLYKTRCSGYMVRRMPGINKFSLGKSCELPGNYELWKELIIKLG